MAMASVSLKVKLGIPCAVKQAEGMSTKGAVYMYARYKALLALLF